MSVSEFPECPYAEDDDVLRQYGRGTLTGAAADTFEAHLFGCDRCDRELRRAVELRAALTPVETATSAPASMPAVASFPDRRFRPLFLAAAAVALVVGLGFWQSRTPWPVAGEPLSPSRPLAQEPMRGSSVPPIAVTSKVSGETFHATWTMPHPGSGGFAGTPVQRPRLYLVEFFAEDGTPLHSITTGETSVTAPLTGTLRVNAFYWNVQALDADGVAIGRSELLKAVRPDTR